MPFATYNAKYTEIILDENTDIRCFRFPSSGNSSHINVLIFMSFTKNILLKSIWQNMDRNSSAYKKGNFIYHNLKGNSYP